MPTTKESSRGTSRLPWLTTALAAISAILVYHGIGDFYSFGFHKSSARFHLGMSPPAATDLSPQEISDFRRDGFILKKQVVTGKALEDLVQTAQSIHKSRSMLDSIFKDSFVKLAMQIWREHEPFAELAFHSSFPSIAAELLEKPGTVRILKDGFFAFKSTNNTGCGFHVDDKYFWPAHDSVTGVNFWLALSHYDSSQGGGIRLVNQSMIDAETFERCRDSIRESMATCQMEKLSPSCHQKMLKSSLVPDMEPGDALIWDRWTFHRSEPFASIVPEVKYRYTIRYVPEASTALGMLHKSVQAGERFHGPYYPQVWPSPLQEELDAINAGIGADYELSFKSSILMLLRKLGL